MRSACLVIVLAIMAGACGQRAIEPFGTLDRDGDGRISREEARHNPQLDRHFAEADADSDGELTAGEYIRMAAER